MWDGEEGEDVGRRCRMRMGKMVGAGTGVGGGEAERADLKLFSVSFSPH